MDKEIELGSQKVKYYLRRNKQACNLRLTVHNDGRIVISGPRRLSQKRAESFISDQAFWILKKLQATNNNSPFFDYSSKTYQKYKKAALDLVLAKLASFNREYGFKIGKITIRNQRTRWGSCSSKGNLSFNYKIVLLPEKLADYVIVHELCHIKYLSHSFDFWQEVERTIPDYSLRRKELKKIGGNID